MRSHNHRRRNRRQSLDDDPVAQEVMPLDRIESQVSGLVESVDEIYGLVDRLTLRVEALENAQPQPQTKEPEAEIP